MMGSVHLGDLIVRGKSRRPWPALKITAFIAFFFPSFVALGITLFLSPNPHKPEPKGKMHHENKNFTTNALTCHDKIESEHASVKQNGRFHLFHSRNPFA
jgi:hypothetical protein